MPATPYSHSEHYKPSVRNPRGTLIIHCAVDRSSPRAVEPVAWPVDATDSVTDAWFDAYWAVEGGRRGPAAEQILRDVVLRPLLPTRFVTVGDHRSVFAVGQVVVVGESACLQCLATCRLTVVRGRAQRWSMR